MPSSFALLGLGVLWSSAVVRGAIEKFSFSLQDTQYFFPKVAAVRTSAMVGMVKL
jgi:hypothetical protein